VERDIIASLYTHYRAEYIYPDVLDYLWSKRASHQNNELLMAWLAGEGARQFPQHNLGMMHTTVKAAYQLIIAHRRGEQLAYTDWGNRKFGAVALW